ncbi:MAG: HypC/HybG/HupF family hydrogenase formation chaperone [Candidatus Komeilibacteria bacterium]
MCLSIPYKILAVNGKFAQADSGSEVKELKLDVIEDQLQVGDFVLVQNDYAVTKISSQQAKDLKKLFG